MYLPADGDGDVRVRGGEAEVRGKRGGGEEHLLPPLQVYR